MTTEEIAERSGLGISAVKEISKLTEWNKMAAKNIVAFSMACGVDLMYPHEHLRFLRRGRLTHLHNATPSQRSAILLLCGILKRVTRSSAE